MNTKWIFALSLLILLFPLQSKAQALVNDTLFAFNQQAEFAGELIILKQAKSGFTFEKGNGGFKAVSLAYANRMRIPRASKTSIRPVILRHKGICYQFSCNKSGKSCPDCTLHWFDRNQDGKVQPRKELRCFCDVQKPCRIRVRKRPCQ